jgi:hypothetical protein
MSSAIGQLEPVDFAEPRSYPEWQEFERGQYARSFGYYQDNDYTPPATTETTATETTESVPDAPPASQPAPKPTPPSQPTTPVAPPPTVPPAPPPSEPPATTGPELP